MMNIAHLGGVEIAYRIDGDTTKPWVTLSNSILLTHKMWREQMEMLCENFCVLRYDNIGHGSSALPSAINYTMGRMVDDLVGLLDFLHIERTHFIGVSLGGMVGVGLAIERPEYLDRLVIANARVDAPVPFKSFWDARIAAVREGGVNAVIEPTLDRWLGAADGTDSLEMRQFLVTMMKRTSPLGFAACANAIKTLDYMPLLSALRLPTLLLAGQQDLAVPPDLMYEIGLEIPQSRFQVVPNAGHISNVENPLSFNKAVNSFLR